METFSALQEKINKLLSLVKETKEQNSILAEENATLQKKLNALNTDSQYAADNIQELYKEKDRIKHVVSDLISSIDSFIEGSSDL